MSQGSPRIAAILLAGGSGSRMNGVTRDKILLPLHGKPAFQYSIESFEASQVVSQLVVVYRDEDQKAKLEKIAAKSNLPIAWAKGGAERHNSVFNGLKQSPKDTQVALIHDCARPLILPSAIQDVARKAAEFGSACVAKKITDTIKQVSPDKTGESAFQLETLDRSKLWAMETPQAFRFPIILRAYQNVIDQGSRITDDLSAMESRGIPTHLVQNGRPNLKLTSPDDIQFLEFFLKNET